MSGEPSDSSYILSSSSSADDSEAEYLMDYAGSIGHGDGPPGSIYSLPPLGNHLHENTNPHTDIAPEKWSAWVQPGTSNKYHLPASWSNMITQQTSNPREIQYPRNLRELVNAVIAAHSSNTSIQTVGFGQKLAESALIYKGGILLNPYGMNQVLRVEGRVLKNPQFADNLFAVESGMTMHQLDSELNKRGLTFSNVQVTYEPTSTVTDAVSKVADAGFVSVSSRVRAIVLVSGMGEVYQIERTNGISDPQLFRSRIPDRTLIQDDDWFNGAVGSTECADIIYSYILEVDEEYSLMESPQITTWDEAKYNLIPPSDDLLPRALARNRHYEMNINPYEIDGEHDCVIQTGFMPTTKLHLGWRNLGNWIGGALTRHRDTQAWLTWLLDFIPNSIPYMRDDALDMIVDQVHGDNTSHVLELITRGGVKAIAIELSYPVDDNFVDSIDDLITIFQDEADRAGWYLAGPMNLKFIAAEDATLPHQFGRHTCTVEMDLLLGVSTPLKIQRYMIRRMIEYNPEVTIHWNLELESFFREEYPRFTPSMEQWLMPRPAREGEPADEMYYEFFDTLGTSILNHV